MECKVPLIFLLMFSLLFIDPLIGSALIGGGVSLLGSLLGSKSSSDNTRETNEMNYKIFHENQEWQENMWNKQNEYNTPANQLALYKEAGYNPLAALNAMNGNSSASAVGSVSSPTMVPNQSGSILASGFNEVGQLIAQSDFLKAQARKANAEAIGTEKNNLTLEEKNRAEIDSINQSTKESVARITDILAGANLKDSQAAGQDIANVYAPGEHGSSIYLNEAQSAALHQQVIESAERIRQGWEQIQINKYDAGTKRLMSNAQSRYISSMVDLMRKQGIKLDADTQKVYQETMTEYWNGRQQEANAKWQEFSNRVRSINGEKFYAGSDVHQDDNTVSGTVNNYAGAANQSTQAAKNVVDCFKPW